MYKHALSLSRRPLTASVPNFLHAKLKKQPQQTFLSYPTVCAICLGKYFSNGAQLFPIRSPPFSSLVSIQIISPKPETQLIGYKFPGYSKPED